MCPRYIRCSTRISPDIIEFDWFKTTCLLPKSAAVIKAISVDWARVILVTLSCKVPYFNQTSVLSHHGQLDVAFAFPSPLFPVLLHISPIVCSLMYGRLVRTGPWAIIPLITLFHLDTAIQTCNIHSNMLRLVKQNLTRCIHVGYHTRKITLPVMPLMVTVTLPIPVL